MSTATTTEGWRLRALAGLWTGAGVGLVFALVEPMFHLGEGGGFRLRLVAIDITAFAALGLILSPFLRFPLGRWLARRPEWRLWLALPLVWATPVVGEALQPLLQPRADRPPGAPDVVLVTLDTTRADRYWAVAEAEDGGALEAQSARFTHVWAGAGLTAPSHASLFTGVAPSRHHLTNNGGVLRWKRPLAEELRGGGYRTLAATSVIHLDPGFGFGTGFDRFASCEDGFAALLRPVQRNLVPKVLLRLLGAGRPVRPAEQTLDRALDLWRRAGADRPRFLWVHLFEPHWPYTPPEGPMDAAPWPEVPLPCFDSAEIVRLRRLYDGEIRDLRRQLASFLEELDADSAARGRELAIVVTGDHGEALGEHGASDHGDLPYDEGLRVPLWISGPGVVPRDIDAAVSLLEVGAGLLSWLIDPADAGRRAGRFAGALEGGALDPAQIAVETDHSTFRNVAWIEDGWKRIGHELVTPEVMARKPVPAARAPARLAWRGPYELYHLTEDPQELVNLYPALDSREKADFARELEPRLRDLGGPSSMHQGVPPEIQRALGELGYLGDD